MCSVGMSRMHGKVQPGASRLDGGEVGEGHLVLSSTIKLALHPQPQILL